MFSKVDGLVLISDDALLARSVQLAAGERCVVKIAHGLAEATKLLA